MTALAKQQKALTDVDSRLEVARAKLSELPALEAEAIEEAVRATPSESPFSLNSRPLKFRKHRDKLRDEIERLEKERSVRERVVTEELTKAAADELVLYIKKADAFTKAEAAGWTRMGELMGELYRTWIAQVVEPAEARDALDDDMRREWAGFSALTDEQLAQAERAMRPAISPFPADFTRTLELVFGAVFDPLRRSYRDEGGARTDTDRVLPTLVPDLRDEYRKPALSSRVYRTQRPDTDPFG